MEPIETEYKGYRFRSRLEARWAVIWEWLSLDWRYEPQGFNLQEVGRYLPDFYLDAHVMLSQRKRENEAGLWVEVKGGEPTSQEMRKAQMLAWETDTPACILTGVQDDDEMWFIVDGGTYCAGWSSVDFVSHLIRYEDNYKLYGACMEAEDALKEARSARFEHGEKGVAG